MSDSNKYPPGFSRDLGRTHHPQVIAAKPKRPAHVQQGPGRANTSYEVFAVPGEVPAAKERS